MRTPGEVCNEASRRLNTKFPYLCRTSLLVKSPIITLWFPQNPPDKASEAVSPGPRIATNGSNPEQTTLRYSLKAVMGSRINSPFSKRSMKRGAISIVWAFPWTISSAITLPTAGLC